MPIYERDLQSKYDIVKTKIIPSIVALTTLAPCCSEFITNPGINLVAGQLLLETNRCQATDREWIYKVFGIQFRVAIFYAYEPIVGDA